MHVSGLSYDCRSGTAEEYTEKDQLLDGAVELFDDEEETKANATKIKVEEKRRRMTTVRLA